jgi:hypothetical protein
MDRAEAIALLQRLPAAQGAFYAGGDSAPVRALLTDDVHWHVPCHNVIAGDYHGIDAVLAYFLPAPGPGRSDLAVAPWRGAGR